MCRSEVNVPVDANISERPRQHMKLTPMLSVMIGVVAALLIVALIVMIVLRIQHSQVDEQSKSQLEGSTTKPVKPAQIQRELRFRECDSLITDEKHPDASFCVKLDAISAGDVSEGDEKNPDIIPQQITGLLHSLLLSLILAPPPPPPDISLLPAAAAAAGIPALFFHKQII